MVGSMFGDIGFPLFAAYSSTKFALRGMAEAMRRELRPQGIGVTYAAPRATRTPAADGFRRADRGLCDDPGRSARGGGAHRARGAAGKAVGLSRRARAPVRAAATPVAGPGRSCRRSPDCRLGRAAVRLLSGNVGRLFELTLLQNEKDS